MTNLPSALGFCLGAVALITSYKGLGSPNHPYQWVLGAISVLVIYHRGWLKKPRNAADYALAVLNLLVLSMQFKLLIGSGVRTPFDWLQVPTIESGAQGSWLPKLGVSWHTWALSQWTVDLTVVQSFLLVVTALAGWLRFQPFASLTALLLLLASVPAFADFHWDWLLPALLAAGVSFYVQADWATAGQVRRHA